MDLNQAARLIEWLDEERRRDKATIATLQERLAQQQESMETLTRRIASMESETTTLRGQVTNSTREVEIIDQLRREMQQLIESVETKRLTAERELERRSELAREAIARPVRELTEKLTRVERQTTELPAINTEKDRLANTVSTLQQRVDDLYKRLEDPERRLTHLEEQRRSDARRLGELEGEAPEIRKALDSIKPKMVLLEDLTIRTERKVQEVQNGDRERRDQLQQFIDQQTLLMQQRDRQVNDLIKQFGEHDETMQRNNERFETWSEAYREMKKIIDDFQRIGDRLERRINEVAEAQRLSEERFRTEWNDFRGDDQKRWKSFNAATDDVWRQHDNEFERYVKQLDAMQALFAPLQDSLNRLWNIERERAEMYRDRYQRLITEHDNALNGITPLTTNGNGTP